MDKQKLKLKERKLKSQHRDKSNVIIKGSLLAVLIAITPYLFYLYESVPDNPIWSTSFFTYESKIYESAQVVMWIITGKLIPILLLLIWFFTCRHWWYHAILVPIVMFIYQIIAFVTADSDIFDEFQLLHLVPIMAIIIPSIYLIRAKMFDKLNSRNKSLEELEEEFAVRPKNIWGKIKQYF